MKIEKEEKEHATRQRENENEYKEKGTKKDKRKRRKRSDNTIHRTLIVFLNGLKERKKERKVRDR